MQKSNNHHTSTFQCYQGNGNRTSFYRFGTGTAATPGNVLMGITPPKGISTRSWYVCTWCPSRSFRTSCDPLHYDNKHSVYGHGFWGCYRDEAWSSQGWDTTCGRSYFDHLCMGQFVASLASMSDTRHHLTFLLQFQVLWFWWCYVLHNVNYTVDFLKIIPWYRHYYPSPNWSPIKLSNPNSTTNPKNKNHSSCRGRKTPKIQESLRLHPQ